jgi:hypothetical protein
MVITSSRKRLAVLSEEQLVGSAANEIQNNDSVTENFEND